VTQTEDDTVILMRLSDPLRAEMIRELLEDEGIVVAVPGLEHRAMLGIAGGYVDIVVRVLASDLERARAIVAALDSADIVPGDDDEVPSDGDDELAREPDRESVTYRESTRGTVRDPVTFHRSKRIAAFAGLWLPFGGAHLYARRYASAAILAFLMIVSFFAIGLGVWLALALPLVIVALDVAGATWHCDRSTTGVAPTGAAWRRFSAEIAIGAVIAWWLAAPHAAAVFAGSNARDLCTALSRCDGNAYSECVTSLADARLDRSVVDDLCARCARASDTCDELASCPCW